MELAVIISLIALAVALPGCIADSLTVIAKIRASLLKKSEASNSLKEAAPRPNSALLKKSLNAHAPRMLTHSGMALLKNLLFRGQQFIQNSPEQDDLNNKQEFQNVLAASAYQDYKKA